MVEPLDIHPALIQFLQRAVRSGPVLRLDCKHRNSGGETLIGSVFCYTAALPRDPQEVAEEAWSLMQTDADAHTRPSKYWLLAKGPEDQVRCRIGFTLEPTSDDENLGDGVGESEEANPKGLLAQLMRHTESLQHSMVEMVGLQTRNHQNERRELHAEISELRGRELETMMMLRKLIFADRDFQIVQKKELRQAEFEAEVMGKINLLFPVMMNRMLGRPTDASQLILEKLAMLRRVLESKPVVIPILLGILKPEQAAAAQELVSGNVGPMTNEVARSFFLSLEREQLDKLAQAGALSGPEFQLIADIYNHYGDEDRKLKAKREAEEAKARALTTEPLNVKRLVEGSANGSAEKGTAA